jgi:copper transport protein
VPITWPPQPDPAALQRVVTAMRGVPDLILHERVTSDVRQGLGTGTPHRRQLSGARFVDSEPYGQGSAPLSSQLAGQDDQMRLALGYPAENTQLELVLAPGGRILRETLTAPNRLLTGTFLSPEENHG